MIGCFSAGKLAGFYAHSHFKRLQARHGIFTVRYDQIQPQQKKRATATETRDRANHARMIKTGEVWPNGQCVQIAQNSVGEFVQNAECE